MPGTFIVRPIEANLTHNTDLIGKMNPYCAFTVGNNRIKGEICKKGGKHPHWNDAITLPMTNESKVLVELMDKDKISRDDNIGSFVLDLQEVQSSGQVSKWYPLTYKNKAAGEILLETIFQGDSLIGGQQNIAQVESQYLTGQQFGENQYYQQERVVGAQPEIIQTEEIISTNVQPTTTIIEKEIISTTTTQPTVAVQEEVIAVDTGRHSNIWTEQRQVVEPHRFTKEVEVVETRSAMKDVEFMEPVKVLKDVQYTQAIPVTKQIEVMEPQVVVKDVEVIEPRLVTKTIQVVENVPVTRMVEVVEMRNTIQEVNTFEPQTFTKQVEVTEYVPVRKQVEVTQPVTLKKTVEFVEPVITTQTITKQMQEAIIIDQQTITTVGPASVVGISQEYGYIQNYGQVSLTERQRIGGLQRWTGFETLFTGLNEEERYFEQQRLSRLSEQEWLREQQRLMALGEQQRLLEQRNIYKTYYTSHPTGFSTGNFATSNIATGHKRHHGFERLYNGLNEKERQFELERWNRLNEQEWLQEQQRLGGFNDEQRLFEQRRLYNDYIQNGGFSTYKKTTEVIEQTTTSGNSAGFNSMNSQQVDLGQKLKVGHTSVYHPSPNF